METDQSNPWTTKEKKSVYENAWIHVREDEVIRPDGNPGIYGIIQFKNKAIGIVPIDDEGYTYLVGQHRYPLDCYSWEIPEGGCPAGEDPLSAAQRELEEETGLTARNWFLIGRSHLSNSVSDEEALFYLAEDLKQGAPQPEGTEKLTQKRVHFDTAVKMVMGGEITDALSMLAILCVAQTLNT